ncbi:unnamed protein product [Mesocestoides corti]|nr:unnamed protein product [Mesocestoides corti]
MEPDQPISAQPPFDEEMAIPEMRRLLLRLKYFQLLRQRRVTPHGRHRSLLKRHSNRSIACLRIKVLLGLAASAYLLAKCNSGSLSVEETDDCGPTLQHQIKINTLKAVLRQRGVSTDSFYERRDLEALVARTGVISATELTLSRAADAFLENLNSTCDREAIFYRSLTSPTFALPRPRRMCDGSHIEPTTVAFNSPGLFIDYVEDNKGSIWILSPVSAGTAARQAINPPAWARLVHHLSLMGVRFGVLLCDKLENICTEYGFSPSNLVMALPVFQSNLKQSVEFRRFTLPHALECDDVTPRGRQDCLLLLDHVVTLIQKSLSPGINSLSSLSQLQQHKSSRPHSLHVIWVPGERLYNQSYPISSVDHHHVFRPPLSLSLLSVAYFGRAEFWRFDESKSTISFADSPTRGSPNLSSANEMLFKLGCSTNSGSTDSRYIFLTPEGFCSVQFVPSFKRLKSFLQWNSPSANDLFVSGLLLINSVIVIAELIRPVLFFRYLLIERVFNGHLRIILQQIFGSSQKKTGSPDSALKIRIELVTNVVKATFVGWKNYSPYLPGAMQFTQPSSETRFQRFFKLTKWSLTPLFDLVIKLFLVNFLFLLAALPTVNLMGHVLPLADFLLHSLRLIVFWLDLASITSTAFTSIVLLKLAASTLVLVIIFDESVNWINSSLAIRRSRTHLNVSSKRDPSNVRSCNTSSVLASSAMLARHLFLSDDELSVDSPPQNCSISDENVEQKLISNDDSLYAYETARLYRKAIKLDRAVSEASRRSDQRSFSNHHLSFQHSTKFISSLPAKLFIWRYVTCAVPSFKLTRSSQFLFESRINDQSNPYDADSESDGNWPVNSLLSAGRRHRQPRVSGKQSKIPRFNFPTWVLPCTECVICWREFETKNLMAALSCGHVFHAKCLKSWLDTGHNTCPMCRWPTHLSHNQREKQLTRQLIKAIEDVFLLHSTQASYHLQQLSWD